MTTRVREQCRPFLAGTRTLGVRLLCVLALAAAAGCAGSQPKDPPETASSLGPGQSGGAVDLKISPILNKEWRLVEIRAAGKTTVVDRDKLSAGGFGKFFTLTLSAGHLSGTAAPNRYNAPYQAETGGGFTIVQPIVSTRMALLTNPGVLGEFDYFRYLEKVNRWQLVRGRLELYTTGADGKEAALVYGE
ncbi:MAG: META domain-containing protein [Treponema sp.]|jgi:hypothetical protein|nr:META domain-containing protein [Treponema sp.]